MQKTRLVNLAFFLAILAGLVLLFLFFLSRCPHPNGSPRDQQHPTLLRQVQTLSQLVTVKYVLEKVIIVEDAKWFGENRVLMVAHGIVKAGVDLGESGGETSRFQAARSSSRCLRRESRMPTWTISRRRWSNVPPRVLRTFDKDLEQNARQQAVDDLNRRRPQQGNFEGCG